MSDLYQEARRQVQICNACRYCEGFCDVFPALMRQRDYDPVDLTHLANLCHNCRGCYYACQYTAPHEFDLNLPAILAQTRAQSWQDYIWPSRFARLFQRSGVVVILAMIGAIALMFWAISALSSGQGAGFYQYLSHFLMVLIFTPAFILPLCVIALGVRRYLRDTAPMGVTWRHWWAACASAGRLKNLNGGHGQGCNYEDQDRYSQTRRYAHQAVLWGFLLCFASTSSATVLHYGFDLYAPYGFWSLPKLLGVPGGILMVLGCAYLMSLKLRAQVDLGASELWGGEMAFILVLGLVALSGLALYGATNTAWTSAMLAIHLGCVLGFFITMPYSKFIHGFFRLAALAVDAARGQDHG